HRRRYETARYSAALTVAAITAGWALSRWPTLLLDLTVYQAAAGHDTLICVIVAVLVGGVILFPALALLFRLTITGRLRATELAPGGQPPLRPSPMDIRALSRLAAASAIAGLGLLNVADATWAHAVGVTCLIGFVVLAFVAIVFPALDERGARA